MINKKISILTICILSIVVLNINIVKSNAQSESVLFEETIIKKIGGEGNDLCDTLIKDGNDYIGIIMFDSSEINGHVNKGSKDLLVVKLDSNLNIINDAPLGGEGEDYISDIIKTKEGYIAVGYSNSISITGSSLSKKDAWILKLDKELNVVKQIIIGETGDDDFTSIREVEDGYILIGETDSPSINGIPTNGDSDILLVKLNKDLNTIKTSIIGGDSYESYYGKTDIINSKNRLLFTFATYSSNILDLETIGVAKNYKDMVIVEVDKDLNILNKKIFGGNKDDVLTSVVNTINGCAFIGYTTSSNIEGINNVEENKDKWFIIEIDNNFNLIKTKCFDSKHSYISVNMSKTKNGYKVLGSVFYASSELEIDDIGLLTLNFDNEFNLINEKFSSTISEINQEMNMYYSFLLNEGEDIFCGPSYNFINSNYDAIVTKVRYLYKNSQSVSLEIVTDNSLEMSISTNKISFEGYNGVEDLNNDNLNLTVSSGLYYDLYATLDSEIRGTNDTNAIIDKANLKIKTSDDLEYKSFNNIGEKVNIVANHKNGRDFIHNINLKLLKDSSVKADTYQTNITFEVVQK